MNIPSHSTGRLDYLDAVRAFALILGIIFHTSLSFTPIFIGWAVMDISTSDAVSIFMLISHSFRMALFFLIAGFFSHMTFHSKGANNFLKTRLVRIGIPFIVGWFLLRPLLVSGWIMGAESLRGDVNILNGLLAGFATLRDIPAFLLVGTHLWFLYYLLLISAGILLLRFILSRHKPLQNLLKQFADASIHWICHSHFAILALAIPTAACLWFMGHWGIDTPDKSLIPYIPAYSLYTGFFLFGWLLHRQASLMENFARLTWGKFVLCLLAIIATITLSSFEMQHFHSHYAVIKTGFLFSYAIMMWSLISLTIGLFKHIINRPSNTVRYLADASYWLYLIHLPIVVWLQIAFAELPLHWLIKLTSISLITVLASLVIYELGVRSTFVGAILNGRRKERVLFKTKRSACLSNVT